MGIAGLLVSLVLILVFTTLSEEKTGKKISISSCTIELLNVEYHLNFSL